MNERGKKNCHYYDCEKFQQVEFVKYEYMFTYKYDWILRQINFVAQIRKRF